MLTSLPLYDGVLLSGTCLMDVPESIALLALGCNCSLIGLIVSKVLNSPKMVVNTMETIAQTFLANLICHLPFANIVDKKCLSTCRAADWACLRRTAKNFLVSIFLVKTGSFLSKRPLSCQNGTFLSKSATLGMPLTSLGLGVRHGFLSL